MKKIYDSRLLWLIVSLLAALVIWINITSQATDEYTVTYRGVRVEFAGEDILRNAREMVITDLDTAAVTVSITGPRRTLASFDSADLIARVDVSKLSQAAYTSQPFTIVYPDGTDTKGLSVSVKTPEVVNFRVSRMRTVEIPVRGSFEGDTAEGYTAKTPIFEPTTIFVSGPEAYLDKITSAWVTFGQNEKVSATYITDIGYELQDANGDVCSTEGLTFSTDIITATLPVLEVKEIPLEVKVIVGAGATTDNTLIKIEPGSVTLVGDSAVLDDINKITIATIDLTDFTSTFTDTYPILFDPAIENLTGVTEAKVTVEIIGLETASFTVDNLSCKNVTSGYNAEVLSENITVTLRGPAELLNEVKAENIRAVADLADFNESTGSYMVPVKINVDGFPDIGAIGDPTISIEIKKS